MLYKEKNILSTTSQCLEYIMFAKDKFESILRYALLPLLIDQLTQQM